MGFSQEPSLDKSLAPKFLSQALLLGNPTQDGTFLSITCQRVWTRNGPQTGDRAPWKWEGHIQPGLYPKGPQPARSMSLGQALGCSRLLLPVLGGLGEEAGWDSNSIKCLSLRHSNMATEKSAGRKAGRGGEAADLRGLWAWGSWGVI